MSIVCLHRNKTLAVVLVQKLVHIIVRIVYLYTVLQQIRVFKIFGQIIKL